MDSKPIDKPPSTPPGMQPGGPRTDTEPDAAFERDDVSQLEAAIVALTAEVASLTAERDALLAERADAAALHSGAAVRVILVDDTDVYLHGLSLALEPFEHEVRILGEAQTAEEALALVRDLQPDVAVVDLKIPPLQGPVQATPDHGLALIKQIKQIAPETRVLALSNHTEIEIVHAAISAGANGYVSKDDNYDGAVFVETFKQIKRGAFMLGPSIAEIVLRSGGLGELVQQAMSKIAQAGRPLPVSSDVIRTLTSINNARLHDATLHQAM